MNRNFFLHWMALPLLAALAVVSCGAPASVTSPPEPTATQETQSQTEPANTAAIAPTFTAEVVEAATAAGPESICNVLIEGLNLRTGPSRAYRPAIRGLPANSVVTPLGFVPKGLVDGSWAYVLDPASQDKGWISAGPQFISCNIDLATLPPVAYDKPQAYVPSTSQVSPGPGTCGQGEIVSEITGDVYDCTVVFSDGFPVQFIILKNGQEAGKADGVQNVTFSASQNDNTIYNITENNEAYCVFGGTAPCPLWILEDYFYKWGAGGVVLESGVYTLSIVGTLDDSSINLFWSADITVTLPP